MALQHHVVLVVGGERDVAARPLVERRLAERRAVAPGGVQEPAAQLGGRGRAVVVEHQPRGGTAEQHHAGAGVHRHAIAWTLDQQAALERARADRADREPVGRTGVEQRHHGGEPARLEPDVVLDQAAIGVAERQHAVERADDREIRPAPDPADDLAQPWHVGREFLGQLAALRGLAAVEPDEIEPVLERQPGQRLERHVDPVARREREARCMLRSVEQHRARHRASAATSDSQASSSGRSSAGITPSPIRAS